MNSYFSTLNRDFVNLFNFNNNYEYINDYSVIILTTLMMSFIWLVLSIGIYLKSSKQLNLYSNFTFQNILIEITLPIFSNIVLYWFSMLTISITSIFIFTIFWSKFFLKFIGEYDETIKDKITTYLNSVK